ILGGIAAGLAGRPHAVHRHVYPHFSPYAPVRAVQRLLYRIVVSRARVVAVAPHIADDVAALGVPRERIDVIRNGVEIPSEPSPPSSGDGPVRVGLLGRLDPQKGADVFTQAADRLAGSAEFVLAAPVIAGRYAEEVVAAARAANVALAIPSGPGIDFLRTLDVVVLASRYEGHPIVLLEAMALGK